MDAKPELILYDIEKTRASLANKLGQLENQVMGTVENARSTVENTVEQIKSTVDDSIQSVKSTFDPKVQIEKRPWVAVGASVAAGFLLGTWIGKKPTTVYKTSSMNSPYAGQPEAGIEPAKVVTDYSGVASRLSDYFSDEIKMVKSAALSIALTAAAKKMQTLFPDAADKINEIVDSASRKIN